ncbi:uncharacterized protein [Procambarus clarkii]|nr:uncharacterized protein LOC123745405 isoform X2 [Procambarus clarkii]
MLHVPLLHGGVQEVLLFTSFTTSTAASFTLACFLLALCSGLLEMLRLLTWWVERRYTGEEQGAPRQDACACKHCTSLTIPVTGEGERKNYDAIHDDDMGARPASTTPLTSPASQHSRRTRHIYWVFVGFLHFLIYVIATLLMLVAMTMNIYLIISMGAGAAAGKMITICVRRRLAYT